MGSTSGSAKKAKSDSGSRDSKKKKRQKHPDAPKRPPSAFMLFINSERENIKAKNPQAKLTEIAKIAGALWQEMKEDAKQKYSDEAAKRKEEYLQKLQSLPPVSSSS